MPVRTGGGVKKYFSARRASTTPFYEHFVLSPVSLHTKMARSHGKIGDCKQSTIGGVPTWRLPYKAL